MRDLSCSVLSIYLFQNVPICGSLEIIVSLPLLSFSLGIFSPLISGEAHYSIRKKKNQLSFFRAFAVDFHVLPTCVVISFVVFDLHF